MTTCDNCLSSNIDDNGTCRDCGCISQEENLVCLPERMYDDDTRMASIIKFNTPDLEVYNYHSKKTSNKELKRVFNREKYYTKYSYFYEGYTEIKRMIDQLRLPQHILVEATKIWKNLLKMNFFKKNHVKDGIFAALIKVSCGIWKIPLTFEEVAEFSCSTLKKIKKSYLVLRREVDFSFNSTTIKSYVIKYIGDFNVSKEKALQLAEIVEKFCNISGKNPFGYVAAIFNILGSLRKEVVEIFPVSLPTVTKRKREILKVIKK